MVRVKSGDENDRLFPSPKEFELCIQSMPNPRSRLATRIMARTSPRVRFCLGLKPKHFFIPDSEDVKIAFVKIRGSKDTSDSEGDGQNRISWIPARLFDRVQEYCDHRGIGPDDEIFDIEYDTIRRDFIKAGKNMVTRTGDEVWYHFRPHDCRRYYANHLIRRLNIDKHLVMEMGGWNSEAALRPYLLHSQPRSIQDRLERQGVLDKDVPEPQLAPEQERLHKRIELLQQQISDLMMKMQGKDVDLSETTARTIDDITLGLVNEIKEDNFVNVDGDGTDDAADSSESESEAEKDKTKNSSLSIFVDGGDVLASLPGYGLLQSCWWTLSILARRSRKERHEAIIGDGASPSAMQMVGGMSAFVAMVTVMGLAMAQIGIYADPTSGEIALSGAQSVTLLAGSAVGISWTLISDYCERIQNESPFDVTTATASRALR